jgi:nucleoside-diphosphate-sugar epimerase
MGVQSLRADLCDPQAAVAACRDVDAVIHTAALAGVWGPRQRYEMINVHATRHLLNAARQLGVGALVYSSSPSVTFDGRPQSGVDESAPYPRRWLCDYPRTKAIAEREVLQANVAGGLRTCSLRPHLIWGTGDPHLIPRLIQRCRSGKLRRVGTGHNLIDTVHVEQAAQAHVLAMEQLLRGNASVAGRAFFITDGDPVACWEWISRILASAGLDAPNRSLSLRAAYRIGLMLETIYRGLGISSEPPMTRFVALQLGVDHYFDIASAKSALGYAPLTQRHKAFDAMTPWIRQL